MLTVQDFLDSGFKVHKDHSSLADTFLQKRVWKEDSVDTLYFVNVYHYVFGDHEMFQLDMSFDKDSKLFPYTYVKCRIEPSATVDDVEKMARDIFISNDGLPYSG